MAVAIRRAFSRIEKLEVTNAITNKPALIIIAYYSHH